MRTQRFDASARILHWSHAVVFIWLLATGSWMFLTSNSLLGDPLIRRSHMYASLPFILLPVTIYIISSLQTRNDVKELVSWDRSDLIWFVSILVGNGADVTGKFNAGQKLNFAATLVLLVGLSFSGFVIWMRSVFSVSFVEFNFLLHDLLAILAILLLAGHIVFALYHRESLRGIISGEVNEKLRKEHYPGWFEQQSE